jgi:hypothetical protein
MVTNWPCDIGGADSTQYHPSTDLFAIIERANYHAGTHRKLVIGCACDCARDHDTHDALNPAWDTADKHCEWVRLARNKADASDWIGCIDALKHVGPVGGSVTTPASASPWPCDQSPATGDADEDLFAVIEIANTWAPVADAQLVIDKACACAKHPKTQIGTQWDTAQKHVDWCHTARLRAAAHQWASCIDGLDHVGGGGDGDTEEAPGGEGSAVQAELAYRFVLDLVRTLQDANRFEAGLSKLPIGPDRAPGPGVELPVMARRSRGVAKKKTKKKAAKKKAARKKR